MSAVCTATGDHPELLTLETMCLFLVCAVFRNHMYFHDLCSWWLRGKDATFGLVLMILDSQLRKRVKEGFCDNPYPDLAPPQNLEWKPWKRILKNYGKNAEVQLSKIDGFWWGCWVGKDPVCFKGLDTRNVIIFRE